MERSKLLLCVLFLSLSLLTPLPTARAVITSTGDVEPANPATWDNSTVGYIGNTANGTLTVDSTDPTSHLLSDWSHIGVGAGVTGVVTVTGINSTWANGANHPRRTRYRDTEHHRRRAP